MYKEIHSLLAQIQKIQCQRRSLIKNRCRIKHISYIREFVMKFVTQFVTPFPHEIQTHSRPHSFSHLVSNIKRVALGTIVSLRLLNATRMRVGSKDFKKLSSTHTKSFGEYPPWVRNAHFEGF